jgi:tetratricopeptide (TPR) repeat protein
MLRPQLFRCFLLILSVLAVASQLFRPLQAQMRSGGTVLRVRVSESKSETVIERARVELIKFPSEVVNTAYTDGSGGVEFGPIEAGSYEVQASKNDFRDAETTVDISARDRIVNASIEMEPRAQASNSHAEKVSAHTLSLPSSATENFQKGMESLQQKKNPRQSLEFFQKAIAAAPDYYEAYFLEGTAYAQLNSPKEAESAFRKAIELKPDFLSPYYPLAMVLFGQKRYDDEEQLLQQAMKQNADGWQWPFELARCTALRGQWDKALEYGHMASGKPSAPSKVHLLMGDLYSNSGHIPEAIAEFEQFVKADPQSPYMPKVEKALVSLRATARTPTSADSR